MHKNIDIKNRIVHYYDIDTGKFEEEIINYLNKKMKITFHSAYFGHFKYILFGKPEEQISNSITVSSYKLRQSDDKYGTLVQ